MNDSNAILIVNNPSEQCGIYQYGVDIFNALSKSSIYNFVYSECGNIENLDNAVMRYNPIFIIYNYYSTTMPWLNANVTSRYAVKQLATMHEVTQHDADVSNTSMVSGWLCPDPTLQQNRGHVFKTARLIPEYNNSYSEPDTITIGSFGFGIWDKGFEKLIEIAKNEFEDIIIKINMPFNTVVDKNGESHALATAERCRKTAEGSKIDLRITHDFMNKNELLDYLASNTINAFFYNTDKHRGISSVIDSALAVNRPIAITKSGMFRHIVNASPSICIEDSDFKTIINNGIKPLLPFYEEWSERNFIKRYEEIIKSVCNGM